MNPREITLTIKLVISSANDEDAMVAASALAESATWAIAKASLPEEWAKARPVDADPLWLGTAKVAVTQRITWEEFAGYGG